MILLKTTQDTLSKLATKNWLKPFYLAGGSALALQYNHRISEDLDFFTLQPFHPSQIKNNLEEAGSFTVTRESESSVIGLFDKAKITFLWYKYPLLMSAVSKSHPVPLAHPLDVGLMKIEAIAQQGARRDFVDLYFICQREKPLKDLLEIYPEKYGKNATPIYHILKSLCYFEDAEKQEDIRTQPRVSWVQIRQFFEGEVTKLAKLYLK